MRRWMGLLMRLFREREEFMRIRLWKTENTKLPAIYLITSDEIRG